MPKSKINRCKFREPLLSTCSGAFAPDSCPYVTNPDACFDYEEAESQSNKGAISPMSLPAQRPIPKRQPTESTETPFDFMERANKELESMGIKYERLEDIPDTPAPNYPCPACGHIVWWWRPPNSIGGKGEWLCYVCHPKPEPSISEAKMPNNF